MINVRTLNESEMQSTRESQKTVTVGRAWLDPEATAENRRPNMRIRMNTDLPFEMQLGPGSQLVLYKNTKREGINPRTNKEFRDSDYRVAVTLDAATADEYIAKQQASRPAATQAA